MIKQYHIPLPKKESMNLEDFLTSSSNEEAVNLLLRSDPSCWSSHAFLLCGASGTGKTHLLSIWANKMKATYVKINSNEIDNLVNGNSNSLAYIIDDVDKIAGNKKAEEWLQHFYNATKDANIPLLLSAKTPPIEWGLSLRDILTRLKSCHTVFLKEPDDILIRGLLLKLFQDRQLLVDMNVIDYISSRLERTGNAIIVSVDKLDKAALEGHRKISIPFAQKILGFKS